MSIYRDRGVCMLHPKQVRILIFVFATAVMLPYTNCSQVNVAFDKAGQPVLGDGYDRAPDSPESDPVSEPAPDPSTNEAANPEPIMESAPPPPAESVANNETETPPPPPPPTTSPSEPTVAEQPPEDFNMASPPPASSETLIPISELETKPDLFEEFACSDGTSVAICHLSANLEMNTLCVGRSASLTHVDHIRTVTVGGAVQTMQDYVGPCRQ